LKNKKYHTGTVLKSYRKIPHWNSSKIQYKNKKYHTGTVLKSNRKIKYTTLEQFYNPIEKQKNTTLEQF
jgi:hypothetical protein